LIDRVQRKGSVNPRFEHKSKRLFGGGDQMQFREVIGVRILVCWVCVSLPFVQIRESIIIRVLLKHVGLLDWQTKFLQPIVWYSWMHLRVLQRRRQPVCANEMLFWNKKSRARTGFPLRRMLQPFRCPIELRQYGRWCCAFRGSPGLRHKPVSKLDGVPPDRDSRDKKKNPSSYQRDPVVMRLNPVDLRHA